MSSYAELIFQLGDIAYERLWNKPNAPRAIARVIKAAEAYEARQVELRDLEAEMDAEEAAYNEFRQACEAEDAECQGQVELHAKAVKLAESKAASVEARLVSRRKDVSAAREALKKVEAKVRELEAIGDAPKAAAARESLKRAKLDLMKRSRECEDLQVEYDQIMNPEEGPAAEAIRARRRQHDLEIQLEERTEGYNARINELNDLAAAKDEEVKAAREAYEAALSILGDEVYRARIADPALAVFYPKIDKLAR